MQAATTIVLIPFIGSIAAGAGEKLLVKDVRYNVMGQMTRVEFGNGNVTAYDYFPLNFRLKQIKTVKADNAVMYGEGGRRLFYFF